MNTGTETRNDAAAKINQAFLEPIRHWVAALVDVYADSVLLSKVLLSKVFLFLLLKFTLFNIIQQISPPGVFLY